MRDDTIAALNAVNRRFYEERASEFSATRERPWSGWGELFESHVSLPPATGRVLDVGCGNGRFARFLGERVGSSFTYLGVDASPLALEEARNRLGGGPNRSWVRHDVVSADEPLPEALADRKFDLVSLFGVLHHVPGRRKRRELVARLAKHLAPDGLVVIALWRFDRHERFVKKLVPWPRFLEMAGVAIDLSDLEPGDHIMTWGASPPAFRYCHAMTENEEHELASLPGLEVVCRFDAASEPNRYYALGRG